jgi:low affinity Fe/Cu permease
MSAASMTSRPLEGCKPKVAELESAPPNAAPSAAAPVKAAPREWFRRFASWTSVAAGSPWTFAGASVLLFVWALSYPLFQGFSNPFDTWQLVVNTLTTIVTFLMVFLIQNTQNRDAKAIHLKLDELIRAHKGARNRLVELENCTDEELEELKREFERIRMRARGPQQHKSDQEIARVEVEQQKRTTDA